MTPPFQTGRGGYWPKRQGPIAVLDVGTRKVCCLIAKQVPAPEWMAEQGQATQLKVVGVGHQRSQGIKGGTVIHMDAAEHAIRAAVDQAERMAGITIQDVVLSVSCGRLKSDVFSASIALSGEAVRDHDIERVIAAGRDYAAREGRTVLHAAATGYRLDGNAGIHDPRGMLAERLSVDMHAVTADEPPLRNLILCVERCHLSVVGAVSSPYASALATISKDEANLGTTCIDIGAGTSTISIFADGQFLFADALAIGGHHVTLHLARSLSTPLDQAERIKSLHGCAFPTPSDESAILSFPTVGEADMPHFNHVSKAQIAEMMRPRLEELLELVRDRVSASGLGSVAGRHVVLTGGASELTGLTDLATRVLGKGARLGRPRALAGLPDTAAGPAFATAVGLLLHAERDTTAAASLQEGRFLRTGTGYLARVGQWIRESF